MGFRVILNDAFPLDTEFFSWDYSDYDGFQYVFAIVPINAEVDWYNNRVRVFSEGNWNRHITMLFATNHNDWDKRYGYREYLSEKDLVTCFGHGERKIVCVLSTGELATVGDYVIRKFDSVKNGFDNYWTFEEHLNNSVSVVEQPYIGVPQLNPFEQVTISTIESAGIMNSYTISTRTDEDGVEIFAGYN